MRAGKLTSVVVVVVSIALASWAQEDRHQDPLPLKDWLVPFEQIRTSEVRQMDTNRHLRPSVNAVPSAASDFITMVPCRILDTRDPNGPFGGPIMNSGETRDYNVPAGPCSGIPTTASAYSLNVSVTQTQASGFLTAWPAGSTQPNAATMTWFAASQTLTTAAIVPAGTGSAISVYAAATTHVIIDINGYFLEEKTSRTIFVSGSGSATDNGTALVNAVNGISGNSDTNRYLVKVSAGVFNVGTNALQMKSFVDIEGSGQNATRILSSRTSSSVDTGSVVGADNSELRSLSVENDGTSGNTYGVVVFVSSTSPTLTDVRLSSTGASWSIALYNNGTPVIRDSSLSASYSIATRNIGVYHAGGAASIVDSSITVTGSSAVSNRGVWNNAGTPTFKRCVVTVGSSGAGTSPGIYNDGTAGTLYLYDSVISATSYSIQNAVAWTNRISNSQLNPGINNAGAGVFTCVATFNSTFGALGTGCT